MSLKQLLIDHGPAAVVIGAIVEGDMTLILSGVVAHLGIFPLPVAIAAGAAGCLIGDCAWFWVGRWRGTWFRAGALYRRVGRRIEGLARRFGVWQLLLSRFVYGTKNASMVFWGLQGLSFGRFIAVDAVGISLGTVVFAGLGYLVSGSAEVLLGRVRRLELWLLGAVVAGVVIVYLVHRLTKRELHLQNEEEDAESLKVSSLASAPSSGDFSRMDPDLLLAELLAGKTAALARAISVVENARPGFEQLLAKVHRSVGRARRIGLTGPPGAGKSTLMERLVAAYRAEGPACGRHRGRSHQPVHRRRPSRRPHPHGIHRPRRGGLHPLHGEPRLAGRARDLHARSL